MAFNETQQELNNLRNLTWQNGKLIELMENGAGAISKEVESGKALIAQAINNAGGEASGDESLAELAEDITTMPIVNVSAFKFSEVPNLAKIITSQTINTATTQWVDDDFRDKLIEIDDRNGDITKIAGYCFCNFQNLQRVNLPFCTVLSFGAFYNSKNLLEVYANNCITVGSSVFRSNYNIEIVNLEKATSIGNYTFGPDTAIYGGTASKLRELNISSFVNSLGDIFSGSAGRFYSFSYLIKFFIGNNYDFNLNCATYQTGIQWTASTYLTTSQDQWENRLTLYQNLLTYTINRLYDHSQDGVTRTFRLGFYTTLVADSQLTTEPYGSELTPLIKAAAQACLTEADNRGWTLSA